MKKLAKREELCIRCGTCETICARLYFRAETREKAAIRIEMDEAGKTVVRVCSQCGLCAGICPIQAITKDRSGVYRLDKKLCVGCLACVGFCPEAAMFHDPGQVEPFKCIACGVCVKECPSAAIFLEDGEKGV